MRSSAAETQSARDRIPISTLRIANEPIALQGPCGCHRGRASPARAVNGSEASSALRFLAACADDGEARSHARSEDQDRRHPREVRGADAKRARYLRNE